MNIEQLYQDYNVDYLTEGHKHCRPGWVNTACPWCTGNLGYHLGYNVHTGHYVCWRCGWHPLNYTLARILHLPIYKVDDLLRDYGMMLQTATAFNKSYATKPHLLPSNTTPLQTQHRHYLEKRKFDPDRLASEWFLLGTGPTSKLDDLNYKHRILLPFIWKGQQVSFDTRDITDRHPAKYMACPKEREIIPHKQILYGKQERWLSTGICVEGPTDVWRLGVRSFATSGIRYTFQQVRTIASYFKRVAVVYDDDPQAIVQADLLVAELKFRGVDAFRVDIKGDPGGMPQTDADYLVKQLL